VSNRFTQSVVEDTALAWSEKSYGTRILLKTSAIVAPLPAVMPSRPAAAGRGCALSLPSFDGATEDVAPALGRRRQRRGHEDRVTDRLHDTARAAECGVDSSQDAAAGFRAR